MKRPTFFTALLVLTLVGLSSCSDSQDLSVSDARSNACAAGDDCGVFMTIANDSEEADTLVGASSDVAMGAGLHTVVMDEQGEMQMTPVENIPVPAAGSVELKPGSLHVMLMGLEQDLAVGDAFSLTLEFENAGDMSVDVTVQAEN